MKKYLLFAIALFSLFVVSPKAITLNNDNFYMGYLKYNNLNLNANSYIYVTGNATRTMSFSLVPYNWAAGTNLYVSFVICSSDGWGSASSNAKEISNISFSKSTYSCMWSNSENTSGRVSMVTFNLKTGPGNEFAGNIYLWQGSNDSYQLIDVVVSDTKFASYADYTSEDAIAKQRELLNKQDQTNSKLDDVKGKQDQTNSKLDDVKGKQDQTNSKLDEAENTRKGILGTIKDVLSNVINIPKKIVEFLVDALKMLFVPTDDHLYEIVNDSKDLSENFGFVGQSMSFFINIFTSLLGMVNANGCIEMPAFKIGATSLFDEHTFWDARNVCLADNAILSANIDTIRTITSIAFVSLFLGFATRKFFSILSKSENEVNS